jgi:hypothetical protein
MRLLVLVGVLGLAVAGACSSSSPKNTADSGAGGSAGGSGGGGGQTCPLNIPENGSSCTGAASCLYGSDCEGTSAFCTGDHWVTGPDVPPDGGNCPTSAPDNGASCPQCMLPTPCPYNPTCEVDGGPTVTATCVSTTAGKTWSVVTDKCEPKDASAEAGDAGSDAGSHEASVSPG